MAKELAKAKDKVVVAEVERFGEKLLIPEAMKIDQAIDLLKRRKAYEEEETVIQTTIDCYPWDGAVALERVLTAKYGWAQQVAQRSFFGKTPPQMIEIASGFGKKITVPWGQFSIPDCEGSINTGVDVTPEGRAQFQLIANVLRKDEATVRDLFAKVAAEVKANSIYRGQAIRVRFLDDDGNLMGLSYPEFLDTASVDPAGLVLSRDLERAVKTSLFTPITRPLDCLANGIPVKRGILLAGTFGTGKTLIAHVASKLAVEAGVTFLYIRKAAELSYAIEFARQYQSPACVIFCEDIDREMDGERNEDMDQILNTIDGIDSKTTNVIVVLTTNNKKGIHPAMLRPGRLDAVLDILPPDAEAIGRLIHVYAKGALEHDIDLHAVGEMLAGNIPAVIAEVVKRAKLSQLSLQEPGTRVLALSSQSLVDAALTIQGQVELLKPADKVEKTSLEVALADVVASAMEGDIGLMKKGLRAVPAIAKAMN